MKRSMVMLGALASALAIVPQAAAETPPPVVVRDLGRFQEMAVTGSARVTGLNAFDDTDKVVSATVILSTDSVSAARQRAERIGARFSRAEAERSVVASQAAVRAQLAASGATIDASLKVVLNAYTVRVKVSDLSKLAAVPGVAQVHVSRTLTLFNGVSDEYTGAPTVWQDYGYTGDGMKIAIIDDGIDYYHATFGGSGDSADFLADDGLTVTDGFFPTTKVAGGYDFVGDAYAADTAVPDPDPLACGHHGTHVGGTAAGQGVLSDGSTFTGPYDADTIASNDFLVAPGSAPEATIYAYRVFGCDGSANDDVILQAIEAAVAADVDVINMSLGSPWGTADEPLAVALDNATAEGVLSVVSAGNEGPSAYMLGGPSSANTVLSVAATDVSSATLPGVAITGAETYTAQNSNAFDFATSGPITGELVDVGLGCDLADYDPAVGKIAVTHRGDCGRVARAIHGTNAGALAVIFVNNADGFPPLEGNISGATIPFVGIPAGVGEAFDTGDVVTLDLGDDIANPAFTMFADFTSNGPRQDSYAKPDISAPGVSILSAEVGTGTGGMLLSGTSMAAPHAAGLAILARQAHPTWGPKAVKGAMMSSADPSGVGEFDPMRGGAGMVSAEGAVTAQAYFATADGRNSLSFGFRQLTGPTDVSRTITVVNKSAAAVTYDLFADLNNLGTDLQVTITPATVTVPAGSQRNVVVRLRITDPESLPDSSADDGGDLAAIRGLVFATPQAPAAGIGTLVTPLVYVPYGVSDIQAAGVGPLTRTAAPSNPVENIKLQNAGVHDGIVDVYQWAITDGKDSPDPMVTDVRDVGVQSFYISETEQLVVFDISSYERVANQATREYDVMIDVDDDGETDYYVIGIDNGLMTSGVPDGIFATFVFDSTFAQVEGWSATAPANGSNVQLVVSSALLGDGDFEFLVASWSVVADLPPDVAGSGFYDIANPAVSNADYFPLAAGDSEMLPVDLDLFEASQQRALGWLVVSTDDTAGPREADHIPLRARRVTR